MAPFKLFTLMYWAVDDLYKQPDVVFSRLTSELNVACVSPLADNHTVVRPFEFESTRWRVFMLLAKVQDLPQRQPSEVPPPTLTCHLPGHSGHCRNRLDVFSSLLFPMLPLTAGTRRSADLRRDANS